MKQIIIGSNSETSHIHLPTVGKRFTKKSSHFALIPHLVLLDAPQRFGDPEQELGAVELGTSLHGADRAPGHEVALAVCLGELLLAAGPALGLLLVGALWLEVVVQVHLHGSAARPGLALVGLDVQGRDLAPRPEATVQGLVLAVTRGVDKPQAATALEVDAGWAGGLDAATEAFARGAREDDAQGAPGVAPGHAAPGAAQIDGTHAFAASTAVKEKVVR